MVDDSTFVHLLSDNKSLAYYSEGKTPTLERIKSHLFLLVRSQKTAIPDHYYLLKQEEEFKDIKSIKDLLLDGLSVLSKKNLDIKENQIFVYESEFGNWQRLITFIPPLILQSVKLHNHAPINDTTIASINSYWREYLKPNCLRTALPYPNIALVEDLIQEGPGLRDLHIHLNGSAETDIVWQDFLRKPSMVYKHLKKGFLDPKILEQFEQESHLLNPHKFYNLLLLARKIRQLFYNLIFEIDDQEIKISSLDALLQKIVFTSHFQDGYQNFKHPFQKLLPEDKDLEKGNDLPAEALMYALVLRELKRDDAEIIAPLFHFYLLIKGLSNRLLVHQVHQYGFEQFQRHTSNTLRNQSEITYHQRFFQIHGNKLRNISLLEGRFSPKQSHVENVVLLNAINKGWGVFEKKIAGEGGKPTLKLVAHFIKKKEDDKSEWIRHRNFRVDLNKRAKVLTILVKRKKWKSLIVGVDAAANELDTPPEVFAPVFRMLRKKEAFRHFTYHVGEDFFHIISGLRAIYEAIEFAHLGEKDRIGHATAAGINSKLWLKSIGKKMFIKKGEWLDNLIFTRHLINKLDIDEFKLSLEKIEGQARKYFKEIYSKDLVFEDYESSWLYRKYCPILAFSNNYNEARMSSVFNFEEWYNVQEIKTNIGASELLKVYHLKSIRNRYNEIIEIKTNEIFGAKALTILQLKLLEFIASKSIVIETLPTSNVRISHYKDYSEYHLFEWKKWKDMNKKIPDIVVGSDDTGIFATNIFNEYIHIYSQLVSGSKQITSTEAVKYLKELNDNGGDFQFINE
ncbi:MAG: hypothetical protein JWP12_1413 [Bacteroidetes bacterium]|nr:hypothetical protein [Bacteroidota bacterium]